MSKNFLSPLRIEVLCLTRVEFTAEKEIPDTYDASFTLTTIPQPLEEATEDGEALWRIDVPLTVKLALTETGNRDKVYARSTLEGHTVVAVPNSALGKDADPAEVLRTQGVMALYSHMRSNFVTLTAQTALNGFILPAIDPVAFIQSVQEDKPEQK